MDTDGLLDFLDPDQRAVAEHIYGPMAVLAGAGTGKTRAITHRIAYAVRTGAFDPRNILAVTFTAKAASEMRSRLRDLGVSPINARTFHSAALAQLRHFWPQAIGGHVPEIKESKIPLVSAAVAALGLDTSKPAIRDFAAEIEWSKVTLCPPEEYEERAREYKRDFIAGTTYRDIAHLISRYEEAKAERGVIDFEDVILLLIGMMREEPEIAEIIRHQYRHFVVDEFQDVSPMQYRLLQLWLGDRKDLCVVGDVAQTIYSFAGARATYLSEFSRHFPQAQIVRLHRDYRSTPQVVDLANTVIGQSQLDGAVHLSSMLPSGRPVSFSEYGDDAHEASEVAGKILTLVESGIQYSDIAILYRTNAQSAVLETTLAQAGIPVSIKDADRFFQRKDVKEAMVSIRSVARLPQHDGLEAAVTDALKQVGWRPEPPVGRGAIRERWDALNTLRELAADMEDKRDASVEEFLAEMAERSQMMNEPATNSVTLASLHASKGLEWKAVFLVGMSEGLMPISLAKGEAGIEEERRLLYVGITRAKEYLAISYARTNTGRADRQRSRFLAEIWPQLQSRATQARKKSAEQAQDFATYHAEDQELFDALSAWRAEVAREAQRKPYLIFHDSVLRDIAIAKPRNLAELGQIKGIGAMKLSYFGQGVLSVVEQFAAR
ncbi:ATP-dependent DNA helicase UvrD2 [Arcanobacterium phocisimile]|uniref:DNA 3'-5' helicase n=1 Tax=Arcanobacterium phocisimile TaxID=1302235 RepID=A0ABX7IHF3_9ACTO|nr:ATP-dependent DNA helicase UvrD2 [Arcanobacterium phocisimile]QRV02554.1 ATP-dependent DNA helicase UvrD2 [Arcanobacterium phocisimile]